MYALSDCNLVIFQMPQVWSSSQNMTKCGVEGRISETVEKRRRNRKEEVGKVRKVVYLQVHIKDIVLVKFID